MPEAPSALTVALIAAIEAGDRDAVAAVVRGKSEAERRTAAPTIIKAAKQFEGGAPVIRFGPARTHEQSHAANVALHAVASVAEFRSLGLAYWPRAEDDLMTRVILERPPEWIDGWLTAAFDAGRDWRVSWRLSRRLVVESEIATPTHDGYIIRLILAGNGGARELLDADPALLDHEVFRLFEVEGSQENSLANSAKYSGDGWKETLVDLSSEGRIDRGRLLDATLSALARDWGAYRLAWYAAFWKALDPTDAERAVRVDAVTRLLSSSAPPIVTFAVDELHAVVKAGAAVPTDLLAALAPALQSPTKRTATRAMSVVDLLARGNAITPEQAAIATVPAAAHPKPEVQRAALKRITAWAPAPSRDLIGALAEISGLVAETERPTLAALLGASAAGTSTTAAHTSPAATPTSEELRARVAALPRGVRAALELDAALDDPDLPLPDAPIAGEPLLDPADAVEPIESVDELGDVLLAAAALGRRRTVSAVEHERLLDAIGRWCGQRELFDGPLRPLEALGKRDRTEHDWGELDAVDLAIAWRDGALPQEERADPPSRRFVLAYERAAAGAARPTLALPTHAGGWIDPRVLAERVAGLPDVLAGASADDDPELAAALLRVPTLREVAGDDAARPGADADGVLKALATARSMQTRAGMLLAATLATAPVEGRGAAVTVVNARASLRADAIRGLPIPLDYRDNGIELPGLTIDTDDLAALDPLEVLVQRTTASTWSRPAATIAIAAPAWRALACRIEGRALAHADAWGEVDHAQPEGRPLQLLLHASEPVDWHRAFVLAGGLVAQRPEVHLLAVDALIATIEDGRVDAALLGPILRDGLESGRLPANRLAARLATVGEVSPLHFAIARDALERALDLQSRPNNLAALLELLDQWTARHATAFSDPAARAFLSSLTGSSKSAKLARSILAREGERPAFEAPLRLEARLRRGERWARLAAEPNA